MRREDAGGLERHFFRFVSCRLGIVSVCTFLEFLVLVLVLVLVCVWVCLDVDLRQ